MALPASSHLTRSVSVIDGAMGVDPDVAVRLQPPRGPGDATAAAGCESNFADEPPYRPALV
jgi:hypothetical protein